LTIEGKWLETIVHMAKFGFLNLAYPKQVQFLVLIHVHGSIVTHIYPCWSPKIHTAIYPKNEKKFEC
jgi:hypothetical protein